MLSTTKPAAILLLDKPQFAYVAIQQVMAQTVPCELVVVKNEAPVGHARNLGLEAARELGCELAVFFDCDDLYAPDWVEQVTRRLEHAPAVGQSEQFVLDVARDQYWIVRGSSSVDLVVVSGGTIGVRLESAVPFAEMDAFEDVDWCVSMAEAGCGVVAMPRGGYLKRQFPEGHTCPTPFEEITRRGGRRLEAAPDWRTMREERQNHG